MFNKEKGEYGYINEYKKRKLIVTFILMLMIIFVVVTVIIMYKTTKSVLIIFAILLSLPFAKFFIAYIMCLRFKSLPKETYERIMDAYSYEDKALMFDIVIAQYEGMKYYDSLCVKNNSIIALVLDKKYENDKKEYETWIKKCLEGSKYSYNIKIFNDVDAYCKKLKSISEPTDQVRLLDKHIRERITVTGV